jgi:hypothetical protein
MSETVSQRMAVSDSVRSGEARISHRVPGRIRISFSGLVDFGATQSRLAKVPGVTRVQTNDLTGSVLVLFEERHVDWKTVYGVACGATETQIRLPRTSFDFDDPSESLPRRILAPVKAEKPVSTPSPATLKLGIELIMALILADYAGFVATLIALALVERKKI